MTRSIIHIDGDSFFASCEVSVNHKLRGLPVVTGQERGIATAMSKEAKALGISRGMPVYQIKKLFPQVVVTQSDYGLYSIFASRMYSIVRRYTPQVEEYSIDECFADITELEADHVETARNIKRDLQEELGMTFSVGLAPTKVLAKLASSKFKPDGFYAPSGETGNSRAYPALAGLDDLRIPTSLREFLKDVPIGKIWGIGPQTARELERLGVRTAGEFVERGEEWVEANLSQPILELWHELRGTSLLNVHYERQDDSKSIQQTRTFTPPSTDKSFIYSELSKNCEGACAKARHAGLSARRVYYFLKTQEFRYKRCQINLVEPSNDPTMIMGEVEKTFPNIFTPGIEYRATGITLAGLVPATLEQESLFASARKDLWKEVLGTADRLDRKFGSHTMMLGSSLAAYKRRGVKSGKRLRLPSLGEVN